MVWAEHGSATAKEISIDAKIRMFVVHQPGETTIAELHDRFHARRKFF
jgi:hypothetical protein